MEQLASIIEADLASGDKRVIAVGECGLDGPSESGAPMERQLRIFDAHVKLARKHRLPLLVHCFRAHPHLLRYLKTEPIPEAGLLMHSYSGSADLTPKYVKAGCHFSFAGPVSFLEARRPLEALRAIPVDRLMAETDAPDQAPHPHRGDRPSESRGRHDGPARGRLRRRDERGRPRSVPIYVSCGIHSRKRSTGDAHDARSPRSA